MMLHVVFQSLGQLLQFGFFCIDNAAFVAFRVGHHQINHLGGGKEVNNPRTAAFSLTSRRHYDLSQTARFLDEVTFVR